MEKEEAIEYLKNLIKNPTISQDPFYPTKIAIDIVSNYIEKLENMYNKEHNEHIEMKRQNGVLRNNERILKEKIEELEIYKNELEKVNKALNLEEGTLAPYTSDIIEGLKRSITQFRNIALNSIPKQKIRDKIEELKKQTSTINDKQISKKYSHTQFARECCIGLLKEVLEEEK